MHVGLDFWKLLELDSGVGEVGVGLAGRGSRQIMEV